MGCLYYGWPVLAHSYADSFVSSTKVAERVSSSVPTTSVPFGAPRLETFY
jgi:hypothetical protein